ncbi:hypothetical protein XELAEV_18028805mg [Xenopus laevis]|uniref:Uncharacterized protein n=1 Tax=Xenopus laevis TaxID=8355 RepID=A0A974CST9_XENLA|nr:hypothetical protein XELAEV_18028805mg [Xenopus laevis]
MQLLSLYLVLCRACLVSIPGAVLSLSCLYTWSCAKPVLSCSKLVTTIPCLKGLNPLSVGIFRKSPYRITAESGVHGTAG